MSTDDQILEHVIELKVAVAALTAQVTEVKEAHALRLDGLENTDKWQTRISVATIPVVTSLHIIAKKLGF